MHNLRHFYYQNKEKIWKIVLFIAFFLGVIYFLNYLVGKGDNQNNESITNKNTVYYDDTNKTYISNKSMVSGETVTESEVKKINNTISKFLQYCKNEEYEQAYNMLSSDCKQNEYTTLQKFQEKYIRAKFNKDSIYEIEKWVNNTYRISISEDLLSTGDVQNNKRYIEYITIVQENSSEKLNINSFIGRTQINKETTQNGIKVTVLSKKTYMDYETYDFKIENLSNKTIKLDTLESIDNMYIVDSNGNKYNSYSNEILSEDLQIRANHSLNITIKYANTYSNDVSIKKIVFENVILDYIKYKATQNVENFKDLCRLEIDL